jgi:hypothetical protein
MRATWPTRLSGGFPAISALLMAPIEMPATHTRNAMPFCSQQAMASGVKAQPYLLPDVG